MRTGKEYNERVEYIRLNPTKARLVRRPQGWCCGAGRRVNECSGVSAAEQKRSWGLMIDRVRMPSDPRTRI